MKTSHPLPREHRIAGSYTFVSLNSRLESDKEDEEKEHRAEFVETKCVQPGQVEAVVRALINKPSTVMEPVNPQSCIPNPEP